MKKLKNLRVLVVSLSDKFSDTCESFTKAKVVTDQAISFESALSKVETEDFDMILLNSAERNNGELIAAARQRNKSVVVIGFSHDAHFRSQMIVDGCNNAVHFKRADGEIVKWLHNLAK